MVLNGKQTPSQQQEDRISPQEKRRPELLLLLLLKNKVTLWGKRRCQLLLQKLIYTLSVCVLRATASGQEREPHSRERAGTRSLPMSQGKYGYILPCAMLVSVKAMAPESRNQPSGGI